MPSFRHVFNPKGMLVLSGHPTTIFCKTSVRRSKCYLEVSVTWVRLKKIYMAIQFMYNFRSLFNKFPTISKFNFVHFTAQVRLFFVQTLTTCKQMAFLKSQHWLSFRYNTIHVHKMYERMLNIREHWRTAKVEGKE